MDETEKYKQRLEAIAEKRRLQEEQDRARRDMEDEKLRLQQLKRKSLRDQWLMEGTLLSPTSPDTQGPRSPLWGSQTPEIVSGVDRLVSQSQDKETLKEQMEDGQVAVTEAEAAAEMVQDAVVQNGNNNVTPSETAEEEVKADQSASLDETAVTLTNGGGHIEASDDTQSATNGSAVASEGVSSMKLESGLSLGVSEAELGHHVPNVNINEEEEEEEEGTLVMRAECVIITDEGDDVPEDNPLQEDQQEALQSEESPLPQSEAVQEEGEVETETFTQPEKSETTETTAETQPDTGDEQGDQETKAEGQDVERDCPSSVQVQSLAKALEGAAVVSVPVYSEMQPSTVTSELQAEGEAAATPEGAEATLTAQSPAPPPGQFQEVPLADLQENQRTEARPREQEPLLSQTRAPAEPAEPAAETQSLTRANQGVETPKHKSCVCCSVM